MKQESELIPFVPFDPVGKRVLVLAPHPDDETIGCGGTLVLHRMAGDQVKIVFLTSGAKGNVSKRYPSDAYVAIRQHEAATAAMVMDIAAIDFWPFEDRELDQAASLVFRLIAVFSEYRPDRIYAPSPQEFHPDHCAAAKWVKQALQIYSEEIELFYYEVNQPIQVSHLVDISPVLTRKIQALQCYKSQLHELPYDEIALALNRFRSLTLPSNVTHAEGFFQEKVRRNNVTPWAGNLLDKQLLHGTHYSLGVLVRTQGKRNEMLRESLQSIADQSGKSLAVVLIHAIEQQTIDSVIALCRKVSGLSYVVLHAEAIQKKRGYPLNIGFQCCCWNNLTFEALSILDDDDLLYKNFCEKMMDVLCNSKADIVYAGSNRKLPGQNSEIGYRPLSVLQLLAQNFIPINSYVIRFSSWLKNPVFFDETLEVTEDWHFLIQLMAAGYRFQSLDEVVCEFRMISDGNRPEKDSPEIWMTAANKIRSYIEESKFTIDGKTLQDYVLNSFVRNVNQLRQIDSLQERITMISQSEKEEIFVQPDWVSVPAWIHRLIKWLKKTFKID